MGTPTKSKHCEDAMSSRMPEPSNIQTRRRPSTQQSNRSSGHESRRPSEMSVYIAGMLGFLATPDASRVNRSSEK